MKRQEKLYVRAPIAFLYAMASRGLNFLILIFSARFLNAEDYGSFSYMIIVANNVAMLSSIGVSSIINVRSAKYLPQSVKPISLIYITSIIIYTLLICVFVLIYFLFSLVNNIAIDISSWVFIVFVAWFTCLSSISEALIYGSQKQIYLLRTLIYIVIIIPILLLTIYNFGIIGSVIAYIIFRLTTSFSNFWISIKYILKYTKYFLSGIFNLNSIYKLFCSTIPLTGSIVLSASALIVSITAITNNYGNEEIAKFAYLYNFYNIITFIFGAIVNYSIATLVKNRAKSKDILYKNIIFSIVLGLILSLSFVVSEGILRLISPQILFQQYSLYLYACSAFLYGISSCFHAYWLSIEKPHLLFVVQSIWALALFSICLYYQESYQGASIAIGIFVAAFLQLLMNILIYIVTIIYKKGYPLDVK